MYMTRTKVIGTALQAATRTKSVKSSSKVPAAEDGLKQDFLLDLDERKRVYLLDPGRFVLFKGRWYFPGVTLRPIVELWNYKHLSSVKPKASHSLVEPKVCSLLSKNLLYMAAGLDGLSAYQYLKPLEERTPAASASVPAPPNLTTKQKLKKYLSTKRFVPAQVLSLEEFLTCLDLKHYLAILPGVSLQDLKRLSEQELAESGIEMDHIVQMKNGINYLMDLHNKSFAFGPAA